MKIVETIKDNIKQYNADELVMGTVDYYAAIYGEAYKNFHHAEIVDGFPIPIQDVAMKGENGIYTSIMEGTEYVQDPKVALERAEAIKGKDGEVFYKSNDLLLSDVKPLSAFFPNMKGKKISRRAVAKAIEDRRNQLLQNKEKPNGPYIDYKVTNTVEVEL